MPRKKRYRGHFCWACDSILPNEKFGGWGHGHHICKKCQKLGKEELSYRQASRNLHRLVTFDGWIPRKNRKSFDRFLTHANPRVREEAKRLSEDHEQNREERRRMYDEEEADIVTAEAFYSSLHENEVPY